MPDAEFGLATREPDDEASDLLERARALLARPEYLSTKTVGNYVSNIFTKLQVADRAQAIIRAWEAGLG